MFEGLIIGILIFFVLCEMFVDFGIIYFLVFGFVVIIVMFKVFKGVWGLIWDCYDLEFFLFSYCVKLK